MIKLFHENILITYCYPGCEKYLKTFIKSINKQLYKKFLLVFFCNNFRIKKKYLSEIQVPYNQFLYKGSATSMRVNSLTKIIKLKPKKIIFADIDDLMDNKRSKIIFYLLDKNSIVFNDLDLNYVGLNKLKKNYLSKFFKNEEKINYKNLLEENLMGMSNSGMTIKVLKENINKIITKKKIIVFDWYFWSKLLQHEYAVFTNNTSTKYNIFLNSKNKIPPSLDVKALKNLLNVKKNFYYLMSTEKEIYKTKYFVYKKFLRYINENRKVSFKNLLNYKLKFWWSVNIKNEY
jgi:hypothetical protein